MKIEFFEVTIPLTGIEGRGVSTEVLGRFTTFEKAENFVEKWQAEHQKWDPYGIRYSNHYVVGKEIIFDITTTKVTFEIE